MEQKSRGHDCKYQLFEQLQVIDMIGGWYFWRIYLKQWKTPWMDSYRECQYYNQFDEESSREVQTQGDPARICCVICTLDLVDVTFCSLVELVELVRVYVLSPLTPISLETHLSAKVQQEEFE